MKKFITLALILTFTTITFGQATTPDSAAKGLWNAWSEKSKTKAAKFASAKVISFVWKYEISEFEMENCDKVKGKMQCWYRDNDGGVLNFTMKKTGTNWKAVSVDYFIEAL